MPGSAHHTDLLVTSRSNARVKQLRAAFREGRRNSEVVAIEGDHLLEEAVRSGLRPEMVFVSERRAVPAWIPAGTPWLRLADAVFASAVETQSPQGLAALVVVPKFQLQDALRVERPLLLVAAELQDPGNLGGLIRSAEAFGASGVLLTPGTVSPWNGKAVRSSAGSVFRMPSVSCTADQMRSVQKQGVRLLAAVRGSAAESAAQVVTDIDLVQSTALMVGNEGSGIAAEWLAMADARVTIPCPGPVESLNAAIAGSILLFEASRQRMASAWQAGGRG